MKINKYVVSIAILLLILFSFFIVFSCSADAPESCILDKNDVYKAIQLTGKCYEFYEDHHIGQLNHIGPLWFSSPSSIITVRFTEDFELIVDGVAQDVKPPMSIFLFRFRGFCPIPIQYSNIDVDKEIMIHGSCEGYVCHQDVQEDKICESPLFQVIDFFDFGQTAWGVTHNDFNEDSYTDFAISWATDTWPGSLPDVYISILINNGDNTFSREDVYTHDWEEYFYIDDLDSGDFDGDGDVDLLFTYSESVDIGGGLMKKTNGTVNLLFNDGLGHFGNRTMVARHCSDVEEEYGRFNPHVTSNDFDNDGDPDFCVGDNSGSIELYWNDGTGSFCSNGILYDYGQLSWGVTSGDFDDDGDVDLLIAAEYEKGSGRICLKRNNFIESDGATCFTSDSGEEVVYLQAGRGSCSLDSMDYNGDGLLDFVAGLTSVTVFLNTGDGFDFFYVGELPGEDGFVDHLYYGAMTSFDMDLDGREDLITGGVQGHVRFCLNNFSELPPLKPSISGESYCDQGIDYKYEYRLYSKDVNYDDVLYFVDWDDETSSGWIGPYPSGKEVVLKHKWNSYGAHLIRVQAKDSNNQMSRVEAFQTVVLSKSKAVSDFDGFFLNPLYGKQSMSLFHLYLYGLHQLLHDKLSYGLDGIFLSDGRLNSDQDRSDTIYNPASFISTNSILECT